MLGEVDPLPPGGLHPLSYISPADGVERVYDLRIPATWDGTSLLPAILLLHGRGGTKQQFQRPEHYAEADARGAVLVFWEGRRIPALGGFPSAYYVDGANGVPDETDILACLDSAMTWAPIDPDRGVRELVLDVAIEGHQGRAEGQSRACLLYTSPSPRDRTRSRMPSSA